MNGVNLNEILFCFLLILKPDNDVPQLDLHRARPLLDAYEDFSSMRASDLKMRIEELLRIKVSFDVLIRVNEIDVRKIVLMGGQFVLLYFFITSLIASNLVITISSSTF